MASTAYMALSLPTVSTTIGPTWATMLNTAFTSIDSHTHISGQGQQVPTAGINVNADFPVNSFNLTLARSVRFVSQSSPLALTTDANCLSVSGGNLYYNNGSAQSVQITSGAALSASSLGGISGLSAPASAAFSSSTGTFTWQSNTNKAAIMDCGPVLIRDTAVSAAAITLQSPVGLGAAYALTLPATLPGSSVLLQMSSSGVLSAFGTVSGSDLTIAGNATVSGNATIASNTIAANTTLVGNVNLSTTGGFGPLISATGSNKSVGVQGNRTATDTSAADVVIGSQATRTAGLLIDVQNPVNGTSKLNVDYQGLLRLASQSGPLQPSSLYTAVTFGSTWFSTGLSYWKDACGVVRVKGPTQTLASPPTNPVFTFPAGFRPTATRLFPCWSTISGAFVNVQVASTGQVSISTINASDTYYLDSIAFAAEA